MLVTLKELLSNAKDHRYAVGAFNVPSLEAIRAVVSAAEGLNCPVILQHAQVHDNLIPLNEIGPIMLQYARKSTVPIAVHLDHGASFEFCVQALKLGFTSIMYDASSKDFETNASETKELVRIAHSVDASVEAELGHVFNSEIGSGGRDSDSAKDYQNLDDIYTDPDLAKQFLEETQVDCLAIAFGTVHGIYLEKPKLDLERIDKIRRKIDIPFVMHGGSGVCDEDYKIAIKNGICKINYYTYMNKAGGEGVRKFIKSKAENDPIFMDDLINESITAMKENVKYAMKVFMSQKN
jgi:fructose-bisphosphate aldolase, class II